MNTRPDIRNHAHADTLLDDYVMGTLPTGDQDWLDAHIPTCPICQTEIPLLMEAAFALPFAVDDPPVTMSDDLWDRIAVTIRQDPGETLPVSEEIRTSLTQRGTIDPTSTWPEPAEHRPFIPLDLSGSDPHSSRRRSSRFTSRRAYTWLAVAAAAILLLGLGAALARSFLWTDENTTPPQTIAMVDGDGNPIAGDVANLQYLPDAGRLVLEMNDMPTAPEGQVYQAWLIAGDSPISIGPVSPPNGQFEYEVNLDDYDAFAITVEPGPNGSASPTSDPVVVAPLVPTT